MSFWKNLFGGGGGGSAQPEAAPGEEYKGFIIRPTLMQAGSEYQLAGVIEKTINGETKSYTFVRADRMSSRDDAVIQPSSKPTALHFEFSFTWRISPPLPQPKSSSGSERSKWGLKRGRSSAEARSGSLSHSTPQ